MYALAFAVSLCPLATASSPPSNFWNRPAVWASTLAGSGAPGDFDGDRRADFAHAESQGLVNGAYRYRVDVRLSAQAGTAFEVASGAAGGLHISARDVDGDDDLDLVISTAFGREPIGIWINDGRGTFTQGTAAYARSLWEETDRRFETPDRPSRVCQPLVAPGSGSTLDPAALSVPPSVEAFSLPPSAGSPILSTLNPGSPFRAPPLR